MKPECHDCGAAPGQPHTPGCDVERCMLCGGQAISCNCVYEVNGFDAATLESTRPDIYTNGPTPEMEAKYDAAVASIGGPEIWTGIWPGEAECVEFGWYCKWVKGRGWVQCAKDDPDAGPNLTRLVTEAVWSRARRRFVLRNGSRPEV